MPINTSLRRPEVVKAHRAPTVLLVAASMAVTLALAASASAFNLGYLTTVRASVSSTESEAGSYSYEPDISADGRYVAFTSGASNLVPDDSNETDDVFVRDLASGETTRASVGSEGQEGSARSEKPSISADGRYVAFQSEAANLVSDDANEANDIFVRDLVAGETWLVSRDSLGSVGNAGSREPDISGDGRYVAFCSDATNLIPKDENLAGDVFLHDLVSEETTRVSVDSEEAEANNWSDLCAMASGGSSVAFRSVATNLVADDANDTDDVFVRNLASGVTTRVSVSSTGVEGNWWSDASDISADGRRVVYRSGATNLVSDDTNDTYDIFLRDLVSGETTRVSESSTGVEGNDWSEAPAISADGRHVVFYSNASVLVPTDANDTWDVFACELVSGAVTRLSVTAAGLEANDGSDLPAISADGRYVAFGSVATNLVADDTNGTDDVFVRDRMARASFSITSTSLTLPKYGDSYALTGKLLSSGKPLVGRRVKLQTATSANGPWTTSSVSVLTTADGSFSLKHVPRTKTYYRARFDREGIYFDACESSVRSALPSVSLDRLTSWSTLYRDKTYYATGYIAPKHSVTDTNKIQIKAAKKGSDGVYREALSFPATYLDYSATKTSYKASVKLTSTGSWRLTAYHAADGANAGTYGNADYVTVALAPVYFSSAPKFSTYTHTYGKTYAVWGYIKPKHATGSEQIKVKAYRKTKQADGSYKYVWKKTFETKISNPSGSTYSKYKGYLRLPYRGKWRLRAYHAADSNNSKTYSSYRYVEVN